MKLRTMNSEMKEEYLLQTRVEVWVVPTNEELMIARDTKDLITK